MKQILVMVFLTGFAGALWGQSVPFTGMDLEQALRQAKSLKKIIFIQIEGDCRECNEVAEKGLSGNRIAPVFQNFICIKAPYGSKDHRQLEDRFRFRSKFPVSLFLNHEGHFLDVMLNKSFSSNDPYIELAARAMSREKNPPLKYFEEQYRNGKRDPVFLKNYLEAIEKTPLNPDGLLEEYVRQLRVEDLYDEEILKFIIRAAPVLDSDVSRLAQFNSKRFHEVFMSMPEDERKRIMTRVFEKSKRKALLDQDAKYMEKVATAIQKAHKDGWKERQRNMLLFYREVKDTARYISTATGYYRNYFERLDLDTVARNEMEKYVDTDDGKRVRGGRLLKTGNEINDMAWTVHEMTDDPEILGRVLKWAERLLVYENPSYVDTYAHILYKMGRIDEAIEWQQKAIDLHNAKYPAPNTKLESELQKMKNRE
ncbi:MAG: hypothetical protein AB2L24_15570 [Mangrovibacterium sp.]